MVFNIIEIRWDYLGKHIGKQKGRDLKPKLWKALDVGKIRIIHLIIYLFTLLSNYSLTIYYVPNNVVGTG